MTLEELLQRWDYLDAFPFPKAADNILGTEDAQSLDSLAWKIVNAKPVVADIGSWKGCSTSILANAIKDRGGKVYAIDHWKGNEGTELTITAAEEDVYSIFKRNMIELGLWETIETMKMDSQSAVKMFPDGTFDLVFLDADHRYAQVKQDIIAWKPKVKLGGILCGHDSELYYSKQSAEAKAVIDSNLTEDVIYNIIHPGVVRALYDCFGDKHSVLLNRIWYYKVEIWNYPVVS